MKKQSGTKQINITPSNMSPVEPRAAFQPSSTTRQPSMPWTMTSRTGWNIFSVSRGNPKSQVSFSMNQLLVDFASPTCCHWLTTCPWFKKTWWQYHTCETCKINLPTGNNLPEKRPNWSSLFCSFVQPCRATVVHLILPISSDATPFLGCFPWK